MQKSFRWFYLLFFLSGFPALIYQIVWQRTLFAEGKPIFDLSMPKDEQLLAKVMHYGDTLPGNVYETEAMETRENILGRTRGAPMVTDDNMATE